MSRALCAERKVAPPRSVTVAPKLLCKASRNKRQYSWLTNEHTLGKFSIIIATECRAFYLFFEISVPFNADCFCGAIRAVTADLLFFLNLLG